MDLFRFRSGSSPLLVSMPHVGTHIPPSLAAEMTPAALEVPDTDWHVDLLYDFLEELGATVVESQGPQLASYTGLDGVGWERSR